METFSHHENIPFNFTYNLWGGTIYNCPGYLAFSMFIILYL